MTKKGIRFTSSLPKDKTAKASKAVRIIKKGMIKIHTYFVSVNDIVFLMGV